MTTTMMKETQESTHDVPPLPQKRGRGRPKKVKEPVDEKSADGEEGEEVVKESPPKGRPKKYATEEEAREAKKERDKERQTALRKEGKISKNEKYNEYKEKAKLYDELIAKLNS